MGLGQSPRLCRLPSGCGGLLPGFVGFGGFNAAGRSSSHHAYRRLVIDSLSSEDRQETLVSLAAMMKLVRFEGGQ